MSARYRTPFPPILGQQLSGILERLDELERQRPGAPGGLGVAVGGGGGGGVGGSGAPNMIPKWTASTFLGNSYFTDDGVNTTFLDYPDNNATNLVLSAYGLWQGSPTIPRLVCRYARGTHAAPAAIVGGDNLGFLSFRGADPLGWSAQDAVQIRVVATPQAPGWTTTDHGASIGFWLTAGPGITPHLRIAISGQGALGIYSGDSDYYANAFRSPAGMTTSRFYTLPPSTPALSGYVLSCTTDGVMSWIAPPGGGGVGGSGTAGQLAKWVGTTTIGNSLLTVDAYGDLGVPGDITTGISLYLNRLTSWTQKSGYVSLYAKLDNRLYYKPYGEPEIGPLGAGGGGVGPGTIDRFAKFTASTTIGDSAFDERGDGSKNMWWPGGTYVDPQSGISYVLKIGSSGVRGLAVYGQCYLGGVTVDPWGDLGVPGDITTNSALYQAPLASGPTKSGYVSLYAKLDNKLYYKAYGGSEVGPLGPGGVGGSGTAGYVPVWTGTTTLGDSPIEKVGNDLHIHALTAMMNSLVPYDDNSVQLGWGDRRWRQIIGVEVDVFAVKPYPQSGSYIGWSDNKWQDIWCVTLHQGDSAYSEKTCPKCSKPFRKGQKLALSVKRVLKNEVVAVPCHVECER